MKTNKIDVSIHVNHNACDGCGHCIEICPSQVFELREISEKEREDLSFFGKLKVRIKGNQKSYVVNPDACLACGICASSCHERAIKLSKLKKSA